MTATAHDVDLRHELLGRIRTHQASITTYVHKMQGRRDLVANISIVSSAIAAALMVGPTTGGPNFTETVQKGLHLADDATVWKSLCLTALIVNVVAAISAQLGKSKDPTQRIATAEACNAALEELGTDVEFGNNSVKLAAAEYGKIASKMLFVAADSAGAAEAYSNNGATTPPTSRIIDRYRRSLEVVMPGMAIVFGSFILVITVIGLILGHGVAAAAPPPPGLALSTSSVKDGETYSVTAKGFLPGEVVKFSWIGGPMADAPPADSGGSTTLPPIVETAPPGKYTLTATGQTSGRTATTEQVVQRSN
jgi:hypothetical protein